MADGEKPALRLQFNPKVRLEFHGATITSDAGLFIDYEFMQWIHILWADLPADSCLAV